MTAHAPIAPRSAGAAPRDVGRVRTLNEDHFVARPDENLWVVADGMGGHNGGEIASEIASTTVGQAFVHRSIDGLVEAVDRGQHRGLRRRRRRPRAQRHGHHGRGARRRRPRGDRGAGHRQRRRLALLPLRRAASSTRSPTDHSLVAEMVREGSLSPEEAAVHPQRNIVTRVLGVHDDVPVDVFAVDPYPGDRYLLCSDGLFNEVPERGIAGVLRRDRRPQPRPPTSSSTSPSTAAAATTSPWWWSTSSTTAAGRRTRRPPWPATPSADLPDRPRAEPGLRRHRHRRGAACAVTPTPPRSTASRSTTTTIVEPTGGRKGRHARRGGRSRRVTWRVLLFVLLVVALIGGVVATIQWYGTSTYFVGLRGRRGGHLQGPARRRALDRPRPRRRAPASAATRCPTSASPTSTTASSRGRSPTPAATSSNIEEQVAELNADDHHDQHDDAPDDDHDGRARGDAGHARRRHDHRVAAHDRARPARPGHAVRRSAPTCSPSVPEDSDIPTTVGPFLGVIVGLPLAAHFAVRRFAPHADGMLLPLAALLNGLGYVFIVRLDEARRRARRARRPAVAVDGARRRRLRRHARGRPRRPRRSSATATPPASSASALLLLPLVPDRRPRDQRQPHLGVARPGQLPARRVRQDRASPCSSPATWSRSASCWPSTVRSDRSPLPDPKHLGPVLIAWGVVARGDDHAEGPGLVAAVLHPVRGACSGWRPSGRPTWRSAWCCSPPARYLAFSAFSHVQERVDIWLNPWPTPTATGYQIVQALFALADGGIAGTGPQPRRAR